MVAREGGGEGERGRGREGERGRERERRVLGQKKNLLLFCPYYTYIFVSIIIDANAIVEIDESRMQVVASRNAYCI
jgi:hypothetical protein